MAKIRTVLILVSRSQDRAAIVACASVQAFARQAKFVLQLLSTHHTTAGQGSKGHRVQRLILCVMFLLVLAGCGADSTPSTEGNVSQNTISATATPAPTTPPTATVTVQPTSTTRPTVTVQPTATAKPLAKVADGLGISRAVIQEQFERSPFNFTFIEEPADDGTPGVTGTSATKGIKIRLTGSPENVQEAQVQVTVGAQGATSEAAVQHMVKLLEVAAPEIDNPVVWLNPRLEKAIKEKTDVALEGNRMISIITAQEINFILLSVLPSPQ